MGVLIVTIGGTILVSLLVVIGLLRFLGCDVYPKPKFPCSECEQLKIGELETYACKACLDEIRGYALSCVNARGTRDCWKNARKTNIARGNVVK